MCYMFAMAMACLYSWFNAYYNSEDLIFAASINTYNEANLEYVLHLFGLPSMLYFFIRNAYRLRDLFYTEVKDW